MVARVTCTYSLWENNLFGYCSSGIICWLGEKFVLWADCLLTRVLYHIYFFFFFFPTWFCPTLISICKNFLKQQFLKLCVWVCDEWPYSLFSINSWNYCTDLLELLRLWTFSGNLLFGLIQTSKQQGDETNRERKNLFRYLDVLTCYNLLIGCFIHSLSNDGALFEFNSTAVSGKTEWITWGGRVGVSLGLFEFFHWTENWRSIMHSQSTGLTRCEMPQLGWKTVWLKQYKCFIILLHSPFQWDWHSWKEESSWTVAYSPAPAVSKLPWGWESPAAMWLSGSCVRNL